MKLLYRLKRWRMSRRRRKKIDKISELFSVDRITPLQELLESGEIKAHPTGSPVYKMFKRAVEK